jgi:hypothetical protein
MDSVESGEAWMMRALVLLKASTAAKNTIEDAGGTLDA